MGGTGVTASGPEVVIVANPVSGQGRGRGVGRRLAERLARRGVAAELHWTSGPGHAEELARRAVALGAATVAVCGGDGTVQEAVRALAGNGTRLALVPSGRCNDFAQALGLGRGLEAAARRIIEPGWRRVDLARVGRSYFCTVAAVGFDAVVSRFVEEMSLPLRGLPAYLYGVLRALIDYRPFEASLTWDQGQYQGPIFLAASANSPTYGGGIPVAPQARCDDGLLEVCLVRPLSRLKVLRFLPTVIRGRHGRVPEVSFLRTRRLTVETERPMEIWADGEPVTTTPQTIEAASGALKIATDG